MSKLPKFDEKKLHYTSKKLNESKIENIQRYTHRLVIVKFLKAKEKTKTLTATKEKSLIIYKGNNEINGECLIRNHKALICHIASDEKKMLSNKLLYPAKLTFKN